MKVKLLKKFRKRFIWSNKSVRFTDKQSPFYFIYPLHSFSRAEVMYCMIYGIRSLSMIRIMKKIKLLMRVYYIPLQIQKSIQNGK